MTPTVQNMKIRFPEFESLEDAVVEFALEEAGLVLGSWNGTARALCQMYLAAHLLAVSRATASADGREVIAESIGRLSTMYARGDPTTGVGEMNSTFYGKRYQQLRYVGVPFLEVI